MEYELPTEFDLIVVGTGMVESIIAAAASRIGKRVLHIDSNNYYGGVWASFNLDSINKTQPDSGLINELNKLSFKEHIAENEKLYPIGNNSFDINVQSHTWHVPDKAQTKPEDSEAAAQSEPASEESSLDNESNSTDIAKEEERKVEETWTQEKLLANSRRFNLDLAPKLHFARGDFVELLISSNIARYSEFRSVSRVVTWLKGQLEVVPCSRSDVFSSTKVSVIEKRMLMKLLTACLNEDEKEFNGYESKTFRTYLKDRKLTDNILHYVLYAISMSTDTTPCFEGIERTKWFLNSLGRFGKTPFLYSMYGSGEITQAFCRLSAVFGGTYALNQPLNGFVFDNENTFKSLLCGHQRISADYLVMGAEKLPEEFVKVKATESISRAIFITDRSIMASEKEHLTLLLMPPENGKSRCTVIELGSLTGTCPKDLYIIHMFMRQETNPEEDLKHCVEKLFTGSGKVAQEGTSQETAETPVPNVLWSFYFTVPDITRLDLRAELPKNVFVCPGPELDLDYDPTIRQARSIFHEIYPECQFLPRAPDPEEIIIEGEDNNNVREGGDNATDEQVTDDNARDPSEGGENVSGGTTSDANIAMAQEGDKGGSNNN